MYRGIQFSNSSSILEWSVKFASQICHENINKPLDGAYLPYFGIDITSQLSLFTGCSFEIQKVNIGCLDF